MSRSRWHPFHPIPSRPIHSIFLPFRSVPFQIGYPVLIRAAYALGGLGSGFAENETEFRLQASKGFAYSDQLIVDQASFFVLLLLFEA